MNQSNRTWADPNLTPPQGHRSRRKSDWESPVESKGKYEMKGKAAEDDPADVQRNSPEAKQLGKRGTQSQRGTLALWKSLWKTFTLCIRNLQLN